MPLNKSKGNMYKFVTHTWNTIKGACPHDCLYCYMKRWKNQRPARFDEKELTTDLGSGNFIFVGSSCDMFAANIPYMWIFETIQHCMAFPENRYLFQTKNPERVLEFTAFLEHINPIICTTIESNRFYGNIMRDSPTIQSRLSGMKQLKQFDLFVTIEPILDFDINALEKIIESIEPKQVNIGADSGNHNLPEPLFEKIAELTQRLKKFTKIVNKRNLSRLNT